VPEINGTADLLKSSRIIANPNCTTAISAMALWPLHREFGLKKVIMSSYQAASGAGAEVFNLICSDCLSISPILTLFVNLHVSYSGYREWKNCELSLGRCLPERRPVLIGSFVDWHLSEMVHSDFFLTSSSGNEIFSHPLPFNVVPHIDKFQVTGHMPICVNLHQAC
jgi:aspartate-semialdehyde dehydrogenase